MAGQINHHAHRLRAELAQRNLVYARGRAHAESYGDPPVIVYAPEQANDRAALGGRPKQPGNSNPSQGTPAEATRHGNFFDQAYQAICARPDWVRRFNKVHAQARSLPKAERRWRELDSSMSSDALLMNVFCTPGVIDSPSVRGMLGIDSTEPPRFGWKARVPLSNGRLDRTEVDMRWGDLLVEAKLTESDFQTCPREVAEAHRDFALLFDRDLLPMARIPLARRKSPAEFPEDYSQEEVRVPADQWQPTLIEKPRESIEGLAGYQLIRNVLAACAEGASFCVILDARRPDLKELWFHIMRAVQPAQMRVRLKVLTWQELAGPLPQPLQEFLDQKYGIVRPGQTASI